MSISRRSFLLGSAAIAAVAVLPAAAGLVHTLDGASWAGVTDNAQEYVVSAFVMREGAWARFSRRLSHAELQAITQRPDPALEAARLFAEPGQAPWGFSVEAAS